jgi:hypothetical protein
MFTFKPEFLKKIFRLETEFAAEINLAEGQWLEEQLDMVKLLMLRSHPGDRGSSPGRYMAFVVDKAVLGQVFSEYLSFPCQSFHKFLLHHNHPGLAQ